MRLGVMILGDLQMGLGHRGVGQSRSSRSAILRHSTFPYISNSGLNVYFFVEAIKQCKFSDTPRPLFAHLSCSRTYQLRGVKLVQSKFSTVG